MISCCLECRPCALRTNLCYNDMEFDSTKCSQFLAATSNQRHHYWPLSLDFDIVFNQGAYIECDCPLSDLCASLCHDYIESSFVLIT